MSLLVLVRCLLYFFLNYTATPENYPYRHTLSLADALPLSSEQNEDRRHVDEPEYSDEEPAPDISNQGCPGIPRLHEVAVDDRGQRAAHWLSLQIGRAHV